ncbi:sensor histidine kinase [Agromyces sp. LHK192]|uniref:sensor histidine kinase n=1 Tax=Agromyces sp. LHK192 TaxID=2498704 RepID=UPI000FDA166E|nr:histidine kinase [Agromyces sp. LHK192]
MTDAPFSPGRPAPAVGGELRLPKPPGVIRRFWARHPRLTDALIAAAYVVPSLVIIVGATTVADGPATGAVVAHVVGVAGVGAALVVLRRSRPWLLIGIAWAACLLAAPAGASDVFAVVFALYALGVYRSTKSAWLGFAGSVLVATVGAYLEAVTGAIPDDGPVAASGQYVVFLLIATLIGITVGNRRRYLEALIARAHDLARDRDQQARLAAAEERARIAREMHDIVSHGLTVMVTLADGSAATVRRDPDRAAEAMRNVAEAGRDALAEMRRMLGVLSEPDGDRAELRPQPGPAEIPDLVDGFRDAGLPVRLTTTGPPIVDPALGLAVYRIVQEGLTNALRHGARASRVTARIEHRGDLIEILVEDDASPADPGTPTIEPAGAGRGLAGLKERIAWYGGSLEAGPRGGRGWRLRATLPTPNPEADR